MVAYLTRMPNGIAGDVTRQSQSKIEAGVLNAALPFPGYGLFGKNVAGKFVPVAEADTADAVYGILVRPFPTQGANASDPLGVSVPKTSGIADVLRSGYISVKNNAGVPALGGAVYIRIGAGTVNQPIGGVEAAADGANTIAVAGASFMSGQDASGNCEIAYNI